MVLLQYIVHIMKIIAMGFIRTLICGNCSYWTVWTTPNIRNSSQCNLITSTSRKVLQGGGC